MAKTFDFNAIKGIRLVDKSGKVKDEAVKSKLGDQNLFRFKDGIVWAKPFKLTIPSLPQGVKSLSVKRTSTKRSLATNGELSDGDDIYYNDTLTVETKPSIGYYPPTLNATSITVKDNHTVSIQAGDTYDWAVIIPPIAEGFSSFSVENYVTNEDVFATDKEQIVDFGKPDHYFSEDEQRSTVYYRDYYTSGNREYRVFVCYPDGFVHRAQVLSGNGIGGFIDLNQDNKIAKFYFSPSNLPMGTVVGYPQTENYVDTIYFNKSLSNGQVVEIFDRIFRFGAKGQTGFYKYTAFYSGGALPISIIFEQDKNTSICYIKGKFTLSTNTISEYVYFDSINGWNNSFSGSVKVEAKPQPWITDSNGEIVDFVGNYNQVLTELMSATSTFDDFSQIK